MGFPGDSLVKNLPSSAGNNSFFPGSEDPLEKEMAHHSTQVFLREIPWTEESDELQSMQLQVSDRT